MLETIRQLFRLRPTADALVMHPGDTLVLIPDANLDSRIVETMREQAKLAQDRGLGRVLVLCNGVNYAVLRSEQSLGLPTPAEVRAMENLPPSKAA